MIRLAAISIVIAQTLIAQQDIPAEIGTVLAQATNVLIIVTPEPEKKVDEISFSRINDSMDLVEWDLGVLSLRAGVSARAIGWLHQNGLSGTSRWAIANMNKGIISQGEQFSRESIIKEIEQSGAEKPASIITRYIRDHPRDLEARVDLITLLHRIAARKTKIILKGRMKIDVENTNSNKLPKQPLITMSPWSIPVFDFEKPKEMLLDNEDNAIWGDYVHALKGMFLEDYWYIVSGLFPESNSEPMEMHSQLVINEYAAVIPKCEDVIQKRISSFVWTYWLYLINATCSDGSRMADVFIDTGFARGLLPPDSIMKRLVLVLYRAEKWPSLGKLLWRYWEERDRYVPERPLEKNDEFRAAQTNDAEMEWDSYYRILIEALLKNGESEKATEVVNRMKQKGCLTNVRGKILALIEKVGQPRLKEIWGV